MAELLIAHGYSPPDSLAIQLREELPDPTHVIVGPVVHRRRFDAVVVVEAGILVLHSRGWDGDILPAAEGSWRSAQHDGGKVAPSHPAPEILEQDRALAAFLADEFPGLRPEVRHLVVLSDPGVRVSPHATVWPPLVESDGLAASVLATQWKGTGPRLSRTLCAELALALQERRLTRTQRAGKPFTFRSGGRFGGGRPVWTLQDAVHHMDRFPEDGIFHLRNGTLLRWFEEQGAAHMARLAREALRATSGDYRETLETFLLSSGLVQRPSVEIRPPVVELGPIVSGETGTAHLRIQRGKGRGYLFGRLRSEQPWLRVEPDRLSDGEIDTWVSVDTRTLPIRSEPYTTRVLLRSSAGAQPVEIPVRFRVTGIPAAWQIWLARPALHAAVAGVLGFAVGLWLGSAGLVLRALPIGLGPVATLLAKPLVWAGLTAVLWAAIGGARGVRTARSPHTAAVLGRWSVSLLFWVVLLLGVSQMGQFAWQQLAMAAGLPGPGGSDWAPVVLLTLAVVPAVWSDLPFWRRSPPTPAERLRGRRLRRRAYVAVGMVLLVAAVVAGLGTRRISLAAMAAGQWTLAGFAHAEQQVDRLVGNMLLRYYDRRAPVQPTPEAQTLLPAVSPLPTEEKPALP